MSSPYIAQQPVNDFSLRFSDQKYTATLAASTDTSLTVPSNAKRFKVVMKAEADASVYVAVNETAAVPAGASFAASTSELIPVNGVLCREVNAADVLHFITAGTDIDVSVILYTIDTISGI